MQLDTIIVGGGFAGLAAATYLGRARRHVVVFDTGSPRNRFAAASHGFLGQDGIAPSTILGTAQEQLRSYPTVAVTKAEASEARVQEDHFSVCTTNGDQLEARKLILAFGLRDAIPSITGLEERWGATVLHCPYCHGFEFSSRPLGVLYCSEASIHQSLLIPEWGPTTLFLNGNPLMTEHVELLEQRGVAIEPEPVVKLEGEGLALSSVTLANGSNREIEALYLVPQSRFSSPLAEQLGLDIEQVVLGPMICTDEHKMSSVNGVYAAGDIARSPHSVSWAVADGVTAAIATHRALVFG